MPYPPVFLKRKPADHPGCLGGHPLSVSLRPFSTRKKDVAAQPISFLEGLRFYARTNHNSRLFQVWPEGHLLSSHEERRQRRAKGEPLGTPDALIFRAIVGLHNGGWPAPKLAGVESPSGAGPEFSLGQPAGGRTPEPAYIHKRGCGPGAWVAIKSWVDIPPPGTGRLHIRPPYRLIRSAQTVFPAPAGSVQNRPDARGGSTGYRRFGAPAPPSGAARRGG